MINQKKAYSGLSGLDAALDYIRCGDNVVWQVSDIDEYLFFSERFIDKALADGKNTVYICFDASLPLIAPRDGLKTREIDMSGGFESVVMMISDIIEEEGRETYYVFDSMTDLQVEWIADWMMGNFFVVTAPEIARTNSVAYFAYARNYHSFESVARIRENAQVLIDIFDDDKYMYLHPIKVQDRYLPTIFLPHRVVMDENASENEVTPLTNGIDLARYFDLVAQSGNVDSTQNLDNWERFFMEKKTLIQRDQEPTDLREMCSMVFGNDAHILDIAVQNVKLRDLIDIKSRMIGVGSIGGKATGMILSRKIVDKRLPEISKLLEPHDSFYICSNLYYTFLIRNKCWGLKIKQRKKRGYFTVAEILKEKILEGAFSDNIREQFRRMLEYFGQSPIIVRSSSLLEDGFGNAFAGKYESVFCVNKGPLEERLLAFEDAVRRVYASTMDESVLEYRQQRGLEYLDEQMALLVQRVSGSLFKDIYMPAAAGVAFSYNAYKWNDNIDPEAGMIRLVMGLGTRAVDRTGGDYPRIASLDNPKLHAMQSKFISDFAQHNVDVLDLTINAHTTISIDEATAKMADWFKSVMIERDAARESELKQYGIEKEVLFTSCDNLLRNEEFVSGMRKILKVVEEEYNYPVDMEFAVNIARTGGFVINLLQCRPLQVGGSGIRMKIPEVTKVNTFFSLCGGTMGGAYFETIDAVVCVDPKGYYEYPYSKKPGIARVIGTINQYYKAVGKVVMLMIPGRIGTSSPELGVPVKFAEISNMSIACEVSYEGAGYLPELSYGSHFFQDLVEADIFYASIFENKETTRYYAPEFFAGMKNILTDIDPDIKDEHVMDIVKVYDVEGKNLKIVSDIESGETLCAIF
ncbi:MAG: PEP/pyruvate-binding domain-containing protein [Clostridiales Family XIII bacterium]|jgi:hypothetical protein|nr:PEP/pyruvate-binding domain-containing protein [Clostridiales Family XIII bacterium]